MRYCPFDGSKMKRFYYDRDAAGYEYEIYACEKGHIIVAEYSPNSNSIRITLVDIEELVRNGYVDIEVAKDIAAYLGVPYLLDNESTQ